ncbi:hypothetical protein GCM10023260_08850 [Bartonella acomydis]|uniref:Uncharacterized protein n=1 Tax=Bartonella acomydis TaxID=686234 RepID=A0ABP9MLB4_9HYPH
MVRLVFFQVRLREQIRTQKRGFSKKNGTPQLSGFVGGIYIGFNINLSHGFILGIETNAIWANRGDKKALFQRFLMLLML